jgi:hypothetical protein
MHVKPWFEEVKGREHLQELGVDGRIILRLMLWEKTDSFSWVCLNQNLITL